MSPATKLALRRFTLRWLRKLVDALDDRLHTAEVTLRNELSTQVSSAISAKVCPLPPHVEAKSAEIFAAGATKNETYMQWEARRSGVAPVSKKEARRRRERQGAAAFDLRFAR